MNALCKGVLTLFVCAGATADIVTRFESPVEGSTAGVPIAGQDSWYLPPVAGTVDSLVMTYTGNVLGIASNPTGDNQFLVGRSGGGTAFARAQRDHDFSTGDEWTAAWDVAALFNGVLPSAPNLGSFSTQPVGTATTQSLYNWVDVATATAWRCAFLPYDANGIQFPQPGVVPDPAFDNLVPNQWYRVNLSFSFASNRVTSVSITNLTTGGSTSFAPTDWYLGGGSTPGTLPRPTAVRFFAGGAAGNIVAIDNFSLTSGGGGPTCDPDFNCDGNADQDDVSCMIDVVAGNPGCECQDPDFNQDGNVDQDDVAALINVIAGGDCP